MSQPDGAHCGRGSFSRHPARTGLCLESFLAEQAEEETQRLIKRGEETQWLIRGEETERLIRGEETQRLIRGEETQRLIRGE